MLSNIKNIIAIASGKGGVGKSTVTANLATAMAAKGLKVGILDGDIHGPSQARIFGIPPTTKPTTTQNNFNPIKTAQGIQLMSMAFLVTEKTPMVWRGPMAAAAFLQLLNQTHWGKLDYLFIDLPPGTGDIQLTLAQKVPLTGALIITTPQDIALIDVSRGIEMFQKVHIPLLGIIENMSHHICTHCGTKEALFGSGGGNQLAQTYATPLLAQLPLNISIRQQMDTGHPTPETATPAQAQAAQHFNTLAPALHHQLTHTPPTPPGPALSMGE